MNLDKKKNNTELDKGKKVFKELLKAYKFVKVVELTKQVRIKELKKKFNRCILVSNKSDIEKEEWTKISFDNTNLRLLNINLILLFPIEKFPIFELI